MDVIPLSTPAPAPLSVHHIPARIMHDGPARVSAYFVPATVPDGLQLANFRGRALRGVSTPLPAGSCGLIFREVAGTDRRAAAGGSGVGGAQPRALSAAAAARAAVSAALSAKKRALAARRNEEEEAAAFAGSSSGGGGFMGDFSGDSDGDASGDGRGERGNDSGAGAGAEAGTGGGAAVPPPITSTARALAVDGVFSSVTRWTHDAPHTDHDVVPRALEWLAIAKALHEDE